VEIETILVDLLLHAASWREPHRGPTGRSSASHLANSRQGVLKVRRVPYGKAFLVYLALHRIDDDLHPAVVRLAGDLLLGRVTIAERHGDELANDAFFDAIAVKPGLARCDHVVLWIAMQAVGPFLAGDGVNLAGGNLDGAWITGHAFGIVAGRKMQPHRF